MHCPYEPTIAAEGGWSIQFSDDRRLRSPRPCQADRGGDPLHWMHRLRLPAYGRRVGDDRGQPPGQRRSLLRPRGVARRGHFRPPRCQLRTVPAGLSRQYDAYLLDPHIRLGLAGAGPARAPDHARCLLRAAATSCPRSTFLIGRRHWNHVARQEHLSAGTAFVADMSWDGTPDARAPRGLSPRGHRATRRRPPSSPRSLFSGVKLLAMNVAPCRSRSGGARDRELVLGVDGQDAHRHVRPVAGVAVDRDGPRRAPVTPGRAQCLEHGAEPGAPRPLDCREENPRGVISVNDPHTPGRLSNARRYCCTYPRAEGICSGGRDAAEDASLRLRQRRLRDEAIVNVREAHEARRLGPRPRRAPWRPPRPPGSRCSRRRDPAWSWGAPSSPCPRSTRSWRPRRLRSSSPWCRPLSSAVRSRRAIPSVKAPFGVSSTSMVTRRAGRELR